MWKFIQFFQRAIIISAVKSAKSWAITASYGVAIFFD